MKIENYIKQKEKPELALIRIRKELKERVKKVAKKKRLGLQEYIEACLGFALDYDGKG